METVLGVKIDNLGKKEILEKIESFLSDGYFHQIATVNPEFILEAQTNEEFKRILNSSDLNVADGIGIWFAFLRFGKLLKTRIAGVDLMHEILEMANEKNLSVFLAVNKNGLSSYEEVRTVLSEKYPNIDLSGANIDPATIRSPHSDRAARIVFCNFGAPLQEEFINSLRNDIIGLAMGVGGSFDYVTKKTKRAPKIMRIFGLEWLWRLIQKSPDRPRRWKRMWNAVIVFPTKVLFSK